MRLTVCEAPTHETRPDQNTGNYVSGFLLSPTNHITLKMQETVGLQFIVLIREDLNV